MEAKSENLVDTDNEIEVLEKKKKDNSTFLDEFSKSMNEEHDDIVL